MPLKITENIIRENAFEQKKRGLNLTLGKALTGLRTTGSRSVALIYAHTPVLIAEICKKKKIHFLKTFLLLNRED